MVVPSPDGKLNPLVLAAAELAGVDEIFRIGGAQAVGALAFGTQTIAPVDKIVGPGNAWVAAAKRRVFGTVGIDMIAGPSEILVLADGENDPGWIAADLLSQAEHDTAAQAILITDDAAFADAVEKAVEGHLATLSRAETAAESWHANGCVIVVDTLEDAVPLIDRVAPDRGGENPQRGRHVPGPLRAGSGGRLRGRPQPRTADGAQRPVLVGARGTGFSQAQFPNPL